MLYSIYLTDHRSEQESKTEGDPDERHALAPGGGGGHVRHDGGGEAHVPLTHSPDDPGQDEDSEVAGENPEQVREGDPQASGDHQGLAAKPAVGNNALNLLGWEKRNIGKVSVFRMRMEKY